jgi:hypothetical protein
MCLWDANVILSVIPTKSLNGTNSVCVCVFVCLYVISTHVPGLAKSRADLLKHPKEKKVENYFIVKLFYCPLHYPLQYNETKNYFLNFFLPFLTLRLVLSLLIFFITSVPLNYQNPNCHLSLKASSGGSLPRNYFLFNSYS